MGLTKAQLSLIAKAQSQGAGEQGVALSDEACSYLLALLVRDLKLGRQFPELDVPLLPFFGTARLDRMAIQNCDFLHLFERLVRVQEDADTYFSCLATLHKARLKYERILRTQSFPTFEQVGPRGLLQYGTMTSKSLASFLLWRKWMFDIDNRSAQETGYVFEPIIASAIGGVPMGPKNSPIRRRRDRSKGRQVDCIRPGRKAYEIKIRVTIAASGQGRWQEELAFPADCRASGYTPVLLVLDPTPNPKLEELRDEFVRHRGEVYVGAAAWAHLDAAAGKTLGQFLETYVHKPLQALLAETPSSESALPEMLVRTTGSQLSVFIGGDSFVVERDVDSSA